MTNIHRETITVLNGLIETSKDGEVGFRTCAEDIKKPELKTLFSTRSQSCAAAAAELQAKVRELGGDPEKSTSMSGDLHRHWVDLKSLITGKDDLAILNEAERGEDHALKIYKKALEKDLPAEIRAVVERQYHGVRLNHDQIKAERDLARVNKM